MSTGLLWAVQLLQLWMEGREDVEMHQVQAALRQLLGPEQWEAIQQGRVPQQPSQLEQGQSPPIGSAEWEEEQEHLETEAAAWPEGRRCSCNCSGDHAYGYP